MLYNDEQTKKEEESFKKDLELLQSFTKEDLEKFSKNILIIGTEMCRLATKPDLTKDESVLLERMKTQIQTSIANFAKLKEISGESLFRQANSYYYRIKASAEEGNEKAKEIYKILRPEFQKLLLEETGKN